MATPYALNAPPAPVEKPSAPSAFAPYLDAVAGLFHPVAGPVANTYNRFHGWKESMGLVNPGTVENVTKEVSRGSCFPQASPKHLAE